MAAAPPAEAAPRTATLPYGTPVMVAILGELSSKTSKLGDAFDVIVAEDVSSEGTVVIPKGAIGHGEVTFVTNKGSFGKPGILGIALRNLELGDRRLVLDGRYREEGGNNNGGAAFTMFMVGIVAAAVQGKTGTIPPGRLLKARLGEDLPFTIGAAPPAVPPLPQPAAAPATPAAAPATPAATEATKTPADPPAPASETASQQGEHR